MRLTDKEFADVWNTETSVKRILATTGYTYGTATTKASRLRRMGYELKYFYPPREFYVELGKLPHRRGLGFKDRELARRAGRLGGLKSRKGKKE